MRTGNKHSRNPNMMTKEELALHAQDLAMDVVRSLQEILTTNPEDPTPDEAEAVLNGVIYVCGTLEGYMIASLPDDRRFNVRAALDHMAAAFAKRVLKPAESGPNQPPSQESAHA